MDDDPVGEGLIMGVNVQRPLFSVQGVFLDEVDIIHTSNLQNTHAKMACDTKYHNNHSVLHL